MITNSAQFNNQPINQPLINKPPVMESSIDGVALVSSDEAINNYPVAGGATIALIDLNRKLLVFKTNDVYYGKGLYYETYDLKKRETAQQVQNGQLTISEEAIKGLQSDIETLKKDYKDIFGMLEELTNPKKEVS